MTPRGRTSTRRGFTLIEMVVVIAIVGILGALTVNSLQSSRSNRSLGDASRAVVSLLTKVRTRASADRSRAADGSAAIATLDNTVTSYQEAGLRVSSATTLSVIGDPDDDPTNGNEDILSVLDLASEFREGSIEVDSPAVTGEIRFRRDGILVNPTPPMADTLVLVNRDNGMTMNIVVSLAGIPRVR